MPSSYIPLKMLRIRHGRKGQAQETAGSLLKGNGRSCLCHFRPLLNALSERTKPRRMHENSTCTQHQQRKNPRLKTRRPKRVQETTTLACQCGQRRHHRCGTHPSHRFSPSQFLFSSWTTLHFVAASLHHSALSVLFSGPLLSARALESANLSRLVSSAAILCSGACIHAGGSSSLQHTSQLSQNRSSHRSPQPLPKSKPPAKCARDSFFHHSGSSPLLSTCRDVAVSAVDVHVVLIGFFLQARQAVHRPSLSSWSSCCSSARRLLRTCSLHTWVVSGTSAWPSGTSR